MDKKKVHIEILLNNGKTITLDDVEYERVEAIKNAMLNDIGFITFVSDDIGCQIIVRTREISAVVAK